MKLKNIWLLIIGIFLLLCVLIFGVVGISRAMAEVDDALENAKNEVDSENNGAEGDNNGNTGGDGDSTVEVKPVTFTMRSEPQFAFYNSPENGYTGIRFVTDVPATVAKNLAENEAYKAYCLIAPLEYFDQVHDESATSMDWVSAFTKAELQFLKVPCEVKYEIVDGCVNSVLSAVITEIAYINTNRVFSAVAFIEKTVDSSNVIRTYAGFAEGQNYRTIARSLGWLAIDRYNKGTFGGAGNENYDELLACVNVIDDSYDVMNGQTTDTAFDNSIYQIVDMQGNMTLKMDQSQILSVSTGGDDVPILMVSENTAIATIENGVVTGVNPGTTEIILVLCGKQYHCTVTVTE